VCKLSESDSNIATFFSSLIIATSQVFVQLFVLGSSFQIIISSSGINDSGVLEINFFVIFLSSVFISK